jgi:hypothetical protein
MDDSNQIEVPPSFCALFTSPAGRLTEPVAVVRARYELCEDLAQMLVEQAATLEFKTGKAQAEVLQSIEAGLTGEGAVVNGPEASWVVRRIAELQG